MIIKSLKVIFNEKEFLFGFTKNCNLIYSKENSKGKTTLVRFLLYALGYQIPATEGIGDFAKSPLASDNNVMVGYLRYECNLDIKTNTIYRRY